MQGESGCFKKHLVAIRERREKRWTQLKLSAPLTTVLAYSPASYPTNTFPQKTQSRAGRVQSEGAERVLEPCKLLFSSDYKKCCKSGPCIVNKQDLSEANTLQNVSCK